MKQFFGTLVAFFLVFTTFSQYTLKGSVTAAQSEKPLEGVTITLSRGNTNLQSVVTDDNSNFIIKNIRTNGRYILKAESIGYKTSRTTIEIADNVTTVSIDLEEQPYFLEPLEVKSVRVSDKAPFTKTNLSKQDIAKNNLGQDLPFLLNQTPSVVINSDAGNGFGYTGIRIRGSDATRTNVTLNGIPYNDPESQGTFFVDMPDIASSLNSIQIQRGVGTSSNGAGAFGATINLSTNEFNEKPYGEFNNSFGSFNTWRHTLKAGTGLINDRFTVDARVSKVSSDGYIDRAFTDLKSLYLSAAYFTKKSSLRFNIISGDEKTYQAWYGVPESMLATNRTYNSAGTQKPGSPYENETDNYKQDHYQLFFNHAFSNKLSFNTTFFLTEGKGYYEQYRARARFSSYNLKDTIIGNTTISRTDIVRQLWLDNSFYGQLLSAEYKAGNDVINVGGGWNRYNGDHFGKIIWASVNIPKDYRWYDFDALKKDENIYAKWQHNFNSNWQAFLDLQYRHVDYNIGGFRNNPNLKVDRKFNFVNPKAGVTYTKNGYQAYLSYAVANKEPNRSDFEASTTTQPKHETLHDVELGFEKRKSNGTYGATFYYMNYKDQLVLTGQINDVGAYTRVNIPKSYRLGLELQAATIITSWLNLGGNLTLSRNKINEGIEYFDNYDTGGQIKIEHKNKNIAYSPDITGAATVNFVPLKNLELSLLSKYVGRQYLDNTENKSRSLNPYYVQDFRAILTVPNKLLSGVNVIAQVNNVLNNKYEPNGYTGSYISRGELVTENYFFPMAGINYMIGVNVKL